MVDYSLLSMQTRPVQTLVNSILVCVAITVVCLVHWKLTFKIAYYDLDIGEGRGLRGSNISIRQSDIAFIQSSSAIWINRTRPILIYDLNGPAFIPVPPNNTFPFTRLAAATSSDQSTTSVYHQINGTTFAEETYDSSVNGWLPTVYFTVSNTDQISY